MSRNADQAKSGKPASRALDPFFVFTYSLLGLALVIQVFLIIWMDLF